MINEVLPSIYRITFQDPQFPITVNQFLIAADRPALIHTGTHPMYDHVRRHVAEVMDPARLEFVVVPHFEADECGGMGRLVAEAPQSTLVCSDAGAMLNLSGWDYAGPYQGMRDGDVLDLGSHRLRFLETPHVHHWDSMMVFEETTQSLFPADLFIQPGPQPPVVRENLGGIMCGLYREVGIFGGSEPVLQAVDRIERMAPQWVHPMHGGSLPQEVLPGYIHALRTEPFAYDGKIFGRALPR
jgi:flavorubredoxin